MKALILAAGLGSRLNTHTQNIPKCLVKIGDKPILEYQLDALKENEILDIIIVIGYKGKYIKEFIKSKDKYQNLNFKFIDNLDYSNSNSGYSFWLARDEVKDECYIHLNCDIIVNANMISELINDNKLDLIVLDKKIELQNNMEQVILNNDNKILKMQNTLLEGASGKAIGVAKFSPKLVQWLISRIHKYIDSGDKNQNYYGVIREAVQYFDIHVLKPQNNQFWEVNTVNDLKNVTNRLEILKNEEENDFKK